MFFQFIFALWGLVAASSALDAGMKGFQNEEKFLEYSLDLQRWIEEEKQDKHQIELIRQRHRPSIWRSCACKNSREEENQIDFFFGKCYHSFFKYSHLLRTKIIPASLQKEELKVLIEKIKVILNVLETTHQHAEEEWEISKTDEEVADSQEYEFVNWESDELAREKEQWKGFIDELEKRLADLN
ncbi:MAG: hypothetical protein mread185_000361 [Mycoplasmataceae bacterium]|nr:MAG: hypothetical protein mread185_000361 [Mycoplasmataceae bacterium]